MRRERERAIEQVRQNVIKINRMNHAIVVSDFLKAIYEGVKRGYQEFEVRFGDILSVYPNTCVPLAGIVDYYQASDITIEFITPPQHVAVTNLSEPLSVQAHSDKLIHYPLNKVWRFNSAEEIHLLVKYVVEEIARQAHCRPGVLDGLTWCLNETMDNVIQHSDIDHGYVMAQIHKSSKHIAVCIYDSGRGVFNSLKGSKHRPRNPADAITLAIKEGVTRDKGVGQGNGLWGLNNIVKSNSGILVITSQSASYYLKGDRVDIYDRIPFLSHNRGGTCIDFQIDFEKTISVSDSLGGYTPLNLSLEHLLDGGGNIKYKLNEKASGTGTRQSGERIRNEILNYFNSGVQVVELDFEGISVVSSSFADELIGKLVTHFGFFGFNQYFRLRNMNTLVQSIVNRSVSQRIAENLAS